MRIPSLLAISLFAFGCAPDSAVTSTPALRAPAFGPVPLLPEWNDDPPTKAKEELGRFLFFDPRLSASGNTNCDICHVAATRFQDNLITAVPDRSYPEAFPRTDRNTTSMLNIVYAPIFRWDGSSTDLVDVMVFPFAEANMNLGQDVPAAQLALYGKITESIPEYMPLFEQAFGENPKTLAPSEVFRRTGRALAAFSRRMVSRDSAFDKWNAGDDGAMNDAAVRGFELFSGRARCSSCHSGPFFTDFAFHNVSTAIPGADGKRDDEGRFAVTGDEKDRGAFLTPTLRSVIDTQPYFHDGSGAFLRDVIAHFTSEAALADPLHDPLLDPSVKLSDAEIADIIEFLRALRGAPLGDEVLAPSTMPP
ncbi:MAG: hypothetical protein IPM54_15960 [Polyangiaceae bacterium]|nr:hypothetical protein [Polyangiaceae bacterium]